MNKTIITSFLMICISILIFNGCKKDYNEDYNNHVTFPLIEGTSSFDIRLTAGYFLKSIDSIQAVNLDLLQISYHTSGDSTVASGWIDLETIPGIYNLMDFVGNDTLVAFDSLEGNQTISQVRMILGDSNTVMIDSVLYELKTPSAQTSGLKVQVHAQMIPDSSYVIMLDFDPQQSIKQTGNGKYKLRPVINAVVNP